MGAIQDYEPAALTTELWALAKAIIAYPISTGKREISQFFWQTAKY